MKNNNKNQGKLNMERNKEGRCMEGRKKET
jgi:hypothetical protein